MMRYYIFFVMVIVGLRMAGQVTYMQPKQKAPAEGMIPIAGSDRYLQFQALSTLCTCEDSLVYDAVNDSLYLRDGSGYYLAPRIYSENDYIFPQFIPFPRKYDLWYAFYSSGYTNGLHYYDGSNWVLLDGDNDPQNEIQDLMYDASTRYLRTNPGNYLGGITIPLFSQSATTAGMVNGSNSETSKFLRGDNTWQSVVTTSPIDSTIVQNSYGTIITETPANTFNIKVDSSKFATPYDVSQVVIDSFHLKTSGQLRLKQGSNIFIVNSLLYGGSSLGANYLPIFSGNQSITNYSGSGIPILTSGQLLSTITDNSSNWNTAYNDKINSVGVTGTTTKTIILTQQDGGTVTGQFTDLDTDTNSGGTVTSVTSGNGMNFTTITGTGSVTMGTPSTLTASTSNAVTSTSHTHEITTFSPSTTYNSSTQPISITSSGKTLGTSLTLNIDTISTKGMATQYDLGISNHWTKASNQIYPNSNSYNVGIGGTGNSAYKLFVDGRVRFDNLNTGTATSLIGRDVNNELVSTTINSYSAGFGLGLNSTTFYNSRYWKNQDTLKTTLTGLLKATSGVLSAASAGTDYQAPLSNPVTGTGTTNYVSKFSGTSSVINSQIYDNGTNVGIGTATVPEKLTVNGNIDIGINSLKTVQTGISEVWYRSTGVDIKNIYTSATGWARNFLQYKNSSNVVYFGLGVVGLGQTGYYGYLGHEYYGAALKISTPNTIDAVNRIGINVPIDSRPLYTLDVRGTPGFFNAGIYGTLDDAMFIGNTGNLSAYRNKIQSSISGTPSESKLNFALSTGASTYADVLLLQGDGKVGINDQTPSYALDVYGDARFTNRSGTPNKLAYFDSNGKIIEGTLLTSSGNTGYIPYYSTATNLADSYIYQRGDNQAFTFASKSTGGIEHGSDNGNSYLFKTPSLSTSYNSGLAIYGTYSSTLSSVKLTSYGVRSGGYNSDMIFSTTFGTSEVERLKLNSSGVTVPSLSGTDTRLTIATSAGLLGSIANGTGYLKSNGAGGFTYDNSTFQSTSLTDGKIRIGNGFNLAAEQTMSGDATMTNTGVVTITPYVEKATSTATQSITDPANGWIKLTVDANPIDNTKITYSNTNDDMTVTTAGTYKITFSCNLIGTVYLSDFVAQFKIYKNGSALTDIINKHYFYNADDNFQYSEIYTLSANDYIDVRVRTPSSAKQFNISQYILTIEKVY